MASKGTQWLDRRPSRGEQLTPPTLLLDGPKFPNSFAGHTRTYPFLFEVLVIIRCAYMIAFVLDPNSHRQDI